LPRQSFGDHERAHIAARRRKNSAQPPVVASLRAFGARWASAWDALKLDSACGYDLPQPGGRARRNRPFGFAFCVQSALRCVEANEPINLTIGANRITINDLNLGRLDRCRALPMYWGELAPIRSERKQRIALEAKEQTLEIHHSALPGSSLNFPAK
jgi:hypothetical protein